MSQGTEITINENVISGSVALVGPPNAGKSTLLNNLLGQKISIVTPKPQTTRNRIVGILNEPDYQVVLLDTPGLHRSRSPFNREMVRVALESLREVDAVVFMIDVSLPPPAGSGTQREQEYTSYFREIEGPAVLVLNKIDLLERARLLPLIETYARLYPFKSIVPLSALKGDGTTVLLQELLKLLPRGPRLFPEDIPTDASERFLAAEIIREKVFLLTGQEIPYSSAVTIDSFKEDPGGTRATIHATILVERTSQKGMIIGKGGTKLKQIGTSARKDIEELLQQRVSLKLWVKIRKNWSRDQRFLRELELD